MLNMKILSYLFLPSYFSLFDFVSDLLSYSSLASLQFATTAAFETVIANSVIGNFKLATVNCQNFTNFSFFLNCTVPFPSAGCRSPKILIASST